MFQPPTVLFRKPFKWFLSFLLKGARAHALCRFSEGYLLLYGTVSSKRQCLEYLRASFGYRMRRHACLGLLRNGSCSLVECHKFPQGESVSSSFSFILKNVVSVSDITADITAGLTAALRVSVALPDSGNAGAVVVQLAPSEGRAFRFVPLYQYILRFLWAPR